MDTKTEFIAQIKTNLENNGFPQKKVSFDLEKLYEIADKKSLSLNSILDELKTEGISTFSNEDKIVFESSQEAAAEMNQEDMMKQAQEMMSKMSPEEIENIKKMYENMSEGQKADIMNKAKDMGMM